jgi:transcriptional regulator with XRE-family HTH domain
MPRPNHYFKEYRKAARLSQDEAAERIGIDRTALSKVENGKRLYNQSLLEAAALVYECTPADLIGRHPGMMRDKRA